MALEFKLPVLQEGVDSATVVKVIVSVGDTISEGDPVIEVETDKAAVEVPSTVAGVVQQIHVKEGDEVSTGQLVLTLAPAEGAAASEPAAPAAAAPGPVVSLEKSEQPQPAGFGEAAPTTRGLLASSRTMAIASLASRVTGFLRTAAIAAALGVVGSGVADAYNLANMLPNMVYELLIGGVLSSVLIPLLVRAQENDEDQGAGRVRGRGRSRGRGVAREDQRAVGAGVGLVARGAEDGATSREDAAAPVDRQVLPAVVEHAPPAVVEADHLATVVDGRGAHRPADHRVEAWAIAAAGQDPDPHGRSLPMPRCAGIRAVALLR
mgnify:CR=1 FL=1